MSTAQLDIRLRDNRVEYALTVPDGRVAALGPTPEDLGDLRRVGQMILSPTSGENPQRSTLLLRDFAKYSMFPPTIERAIRRWAISEPDRSALGVRCETDELANLPWEILPSALSMRDPFVVRIPRQTEVRRVEFASPVRVLVAGWPKLFDLPMPGIDRELLELPGVSAEGQLEISALSQPTLDQLADSYLSYEPAILHLSSPAVVTHNGEAQIATADLEGRLAWVTATSLATALGKNPHLCLLVLNSCEGGLTAARDLAETLGITVVSWAGWIQDQLAYDFAVFFYRRLLEGATAVEAVRSFIQPFATRPEGSLSPIPVVWIPSLKSLTLTLPIQTLREAQRSMTRGAAVATGSSAEEASQLKEAFELKVEFDPLPVLSPALLVNGRSAIERLTLTTSRDVRNVRLTVECDAGSGFSSVRQTVSLSKGPNPVTFDQMRFPILYDLISSGATRRYINFVVTATQQGDVLAESTRPVLMMAAKEWMDRPETWPFIPSFVQPNARGVRAIITEADPVLKQTGSPTDSFDGYQTGDPDHVGRQVRAIFVALRDRYSLGYINPPSSPVYVPGDSLPAGQLVRFPDEILEDRRGTCHDLALLFASCLEHVGIFPLVVLIRGHTFFGFWQSNHDHSDFWDRHRDRRATVRSKGFGSSWMLDLGDLVENVERGSIEVVEATAVTNRNATYETACDQRTEQLRSLPSSDFDVALDIVASRYAVQPV